MQLGDVRVWSQGIGWDSIQEGRLAKDGRDTPDVNTSAHNLNKAMRNPHSDSVEEFSEL